MRVMHIGNKGTPQHKTIFVMDEKELDELDELVKKHESLGFNKDYALYASLSVLEERATNGGC